jgi:hypothetical protein
MDEPSPATLTQEFRTAIKKEAVAQTVKWGGVGLVTLLGLAVTGWWLVLEPWLAQRLGAVPKNAVMAFAPEIGKCPPGWTEFSDAVGRTIVGKGTHFTDTDPKLQLDAKGRHLTLSSWPHGGEFLAANLIGEVPPANDFGKMNIVPWIALRFCKRD